MALGRAFLVAILVSAVAACGRLGTQSPVQIARPTEAAIVATASPVITASTSLAPTDPPPSPNPAPTTQPTPEPTPVPVPPKPTGVTFDQQRRGGIDALTDEITQTATWEAPRSKGVEIRVYGVTECVSKPANPSPGTSGPCLVGRTPLPGSVRTLLATAPASDGVATWSWTGTFDCGPALAYPLDGPGYDAVVLAAYSPSGHSKFAIAAPGSWYQPALDETVC